MVRGALVVVLVLAAAAATHADVLCRKRNGALAARASCTRTESQVDPAALGLVGPRGQDGLTGPTGATGAPPDGFVVAFARIRADGTLASFGGSRTTVAAAQRAVGAGPGDYVVTFLGDYPADVWGERLTVLASAESRSFHVADAWVRSASAGMIQLEVYAWSSPVPQPSDDDVFVAVLYGRAAP